VLPHAGDGGESVWRSWFRETGDRSWQHPLILVLLIAAGIGLELVVHARLGIPVVYTHFFYLIVAIAGLFIGRRAVMLAVLLGGLHVAVDTWLTGSPAVDALIRAGMLCIVSLVIGASVEEMTRARSELEERNLQLQASERAFQIANRKLNLLSSITRHDIVNQLTSLRGRVDLLAEEDDSEQVRKGLEQQRATIATIQRLIEFTRDYQEIGVHAPKWQRLDAILAGAGRQEGLGGIRLAVDVDGLEVYADPMLERICDNLIDNSIRHGERVTEIRVYFRTDGDSLTVVYQDDGVGVPEADKERIFEKGVGANTGFGLFLSREILEITGLTIRETGVFGEGARFEIRVPGGLYRFPDAGPAQA